MNARHIFALLTLILLLSPAAAAAGDDNQPANDKEIYIPPIVVTADRQNEPIDEVTYPMSYVPRQEIDEMQAQSAADVLQTQLGVDITTLGSPADDVDIRIRGSDSDEVVVLLDNVPLNTVLDNRPTGLGTIPASFIDHIEVLRSAHTGMYGSRALGGVVNIITRKGSEGIGGLTGFHGGNLGRYIEDAAFSLGKGNHLFRLAYQRWDQYGRFSNDALAQNAVNLNWHFQWTPEFSVSLSPTYLNTVQQLAFDSIQENDVVYFPRDYNRRMRRDLLVVPFALELHATKWLDAYFEYGLLYDFFRLQDPPEGDTTPGLVVGDQYARSNEYRNRISARTVITPLDYKGFEDLITVGYDMDSENLSFKTGPYHGPLEEFPQPGQTFDRRNDAIYVQNVFKYKKYITLSGGFRYDHNTMFDQSLTSRGSLAARIPKTGTVFKASYNETFNAPLIMLLNFSPIIQKETARNYSAGIEQDLWKKGTAELYFYYTDYGSYFLDNADAVGTDDAYAMGVEAALDVKPLDWLRLRGSYAWTRARDRTRDVPLPDRPTNRVTFTGDVEPVKRLHLQLWVDYVGTRYFGTNSGLTFVNWKGEVCTGKLSPYVKMDFAGTYSLPLKKVAKSLEFSAKVENILNQSYEEKFGHPMPGINILAGVNANF